MSRRPLAMNRRAAMLGGGCAVSTLALARSTQGHALGQTPSPTLVSSAAAAPTASTLSPERIDAIWQASIAEYAPQRQIQMERVEQGVDAGPFRPDWASLKAYQTPDWYQDAKFGIFVHWGVYSVPEFGSEWYSRNMYQEGSREYLHHRATYGPQDQFGYKDLIPLFKAEAWSPAAWAELFHRAGARYVVPVAEHHDGFALYDSRMSNWTSVRMGPKRDVIGELATAFRAMGLRLGLSSHRAEHVWFFDGGRKMASDVNDPAYAALYGPAQTRLPGPRDEDLQQEFTPVSQAWLDDWTARTAELVDLYAPDLIYFDWWVGHPTFRNTMPPFLAYYYNTQAARGEGAVVNYKLDLFAPGTAVLDIERGQAPGIRPDTWQTCTSISNQSWGYIAGDTYKSPDALIHLLIDVVSKNGNLLLNIGPRADGSIPEEAERILLAMGDWLKVNGEAIYETRPWRVFGEGPTEVLAGTMQEKQAKPFTAEDFRFTTRNGVLYASALGWPETGAAVIRSVTAADGARRVTLLATGQPIPFRQAEDGLHLTLPSRSSGDHAHVFRIELA